MLKARIKIWLLATLGLLIWLLVVWLVLRFLKLNTRETKTVAAFLIVLGVGAISSLVWYFLKQLKAKEGQKGSGPDEMDASISTARARLAAAKLSDKTRLSQLPLILCLGPSDSAKTSVLVRSGLDPDLLSGEVQRGDAVVATRGVNLWYSNKTILLEAGGRLVADAGRFSRLVRFIQPQRVSAVLSSGRQAPRIAIVCLSCEDLVRPGGGEQVMTHARDLRSRLLEVSKKLGIRLPVYVVFTKADKIPYFTDFVRNFSSEEAKEVLGATLPWDSGPAGTYADRTASRISSSMQRLGASLAGHRLQFLPRETQPAVLYGAYEFAREFRKLIPQATQFLVDLCKPSQLEVSPVLRGFYFSGVRAVVVEDAAMAVQQQQRQAAPVQMDATQVFVPAAYNMQSAPAGPVGSASRKVPQWMFLGRLFKDVIFKDRVALAATAGGARVNMLRRALLVTASVIAVFYSLMLLISLTSNRRMINRAEAVIRNVSGDPLPPGDLASTDALRRLDSLRMVTQTLGEWNRGSPKIGYRWGLYSGNMLYPHVRRYYFARFDSLLYRKTANRIVDNLLNFPPTRNDSSDYKWSYWQLKAHLITTSFPTRSMPDSLVPVLRDAWMQGRPKPAGEKVILAEQQFRFFAEELARAGRSPWGDGADSALVVRAQNFLQQFKDVTQVYEIMRLDAARNGAKPFDFNGTYPAAAQVLTTSPVIPAAFTRPAWLYMWEEAFKKHERYFQGEDWVLGAERISETDRYARVNQIRQMYRDDYARYWKQQLSNARIATFGNLQDAARKVKVLGNNPSPLIQLINAVSINTAMDSAFANTIFQPALVVSPADSIKQVGEKIAPYMKALQELGTALDEVNAAGPTEREGPAQEAKNHVAEAKNAAQSVGIDFGSAAGGVGPDINRLLQSGFNSVETFLGGVGVAGVNRTGADFCSANARVMTKSPLNPRGPAASLDEVNAFFGRPDGALWSLYNTTLSKFMTKVGNTYAAMPGASTKPGGQFLNFFNHAAAFSRVLYPDGAEVVPRLGFTLRAVINDNVTQVKLTVNGTTRTWSAFRTADQPYVWLGPEASDVVLEVTIKGNTQQKKYSGTWALWQLFADARNWKPSGIKQTAEWSFTHENQPVPVQFDLTIPDGTPILTPDWLRETVCVSRIAQ